MGFAAPSKVVDGISQVPLPLTSAPVIETNLSNKDRIP